MILPMTSARSAIWLRTADRPVPPRVEPLRQRGPEGDLRRVLAALSAVSDPMTGRDIVSTGRVVALEIDAGEATLTLRMGAGHCDHAHHVAEEAFDVLRLHLPDTDLFLRHQSEVACAGGAVAGDPVQASRPLW
jgi:hypothetical protein